jgi:deoxycytidine triphosphate deaminase
MFLLTDKMILEYIQEGLLEIRDFDEKFLHPTYYYFRLGKWVGIWNENVKDYHYEELGEPGREVLSIPPRGYALIKSLEWFKCSKKVLAIFGHTSALPRKGLRLNHSPTIDPNFAGYLEMGLENLLDKHREIRYGDIIGKVLFFDISDTYPVRDIKGTLSEKEYKRRETLERPIPIE